MRHEALVPGVGGGVEDVDGLLDRPAEAVDHAAEAAADAASSDEMEAKGRPDGRGCVGVEDPDREVEEDATVNDRRGLAGRVVDQDYRLWKK